MVLVCLKSHHQTPGDLDILLCFLTEALVLCFTFRLTIHFELICVKAVEPVFFFAYGCPVVPVPLVENTSPFWLNHLCFFVREKLSQLTVFLWVYIWVLYFVILICIYFFSKIGERDHGELVSFFFLNVRKNSPVKSYEYDAFRGDVY